MLEEIFFGLNGLTNLTVVIITFYIYLVWYKSQNLSRLAKIIGVTGLIFLIPTYLNLAWFLGILIPKTQDFVLIQGCINVFIASVYLVMVYKALKNRYLIYFLFLFSLSIFAISFNIDIFFLLLSAISFLLFLILSLDILYRSNTYLKLIGIFGSIYALISSVYLFLIFIGQSPLKFPWFIPNVLIFLLFLFYYKNIYFYHISRPQKIKIKIPTVVYFFRLLFFIFSICLFLFITTLSFHELGHALAAKYYGCERSRAVIYDIAMEPHTEIICRDYYNPIIITLAGLILTLLMGTLFIFIGNKLTNIFSLLIYGFSLLMAYGDLIDINLSINIVATISLIGIILIITGISRLAIIFMKKQSNFFEDNHTQEYLSLDENTYIKNLYDLSEKINKMSNLKFKNFITDGKEDLQFWIKEVIKDENLAKQLSKIQDKKRFETAILKKLLKDNASN